MLEVEIVLFLSSSKEIIFCNSDDYLTPNKTAHGIVYKMFVRLTCCFKCCYSDGVATIMRSISESEYKYE